MLLILLLGISLGIGGIGCLAGNPFEVERYDTGDAFEWSGDKNCSDFNGYFRGENTKDCNTTLECCCLFSHTFDTLTGRCHVPNRKYQFSRYKSFYTDVSTMQAYCLQNVEHKELKDCILISTTAGIELPVIFKGNDREVDLLGSCDVVDVRIIHDCMSRNLSQVIAILRQNNLNENYYLHLEPVPSEIISKLKGELLEITINCTECGLDKLLFKFAGKVDLCQDKRLLNEFIPHYDPKHHPDSSSCPNKSSIPPSSSPLNAHSSSSKDAMIPIIIGPLSICIVLVLILIGYYYGRERRRRRINNGVRQRLIPEGAEREVGQPQPQPQPQPPHVLVPPPPVPVTISISTDESVDSSTTRSTRSNMTSSQSTVVDLVTSQAPYQV